MDASIVFLHYRQKNRKSWRLNFVGTNVANRIPITVAILWTRLTELINRRTTSVCASINRHAVCTQDVDRGHPSQIQGWVGCVGETGRTGGVGIQVIGTVRCHSPPTAVSTAWTVGDDGVDQGSRSLVKYSTTGIDCTISGDCTVRDSQNTFIFNSTTGVTGIVFGYGGVKLRSAFRRLQFHLPIGQYCCRPRCLKK